jgi:hypothetical protein
LNEEKELDDKIKRFEEQALLQEKTLNQLE